MYTAPVYDCLSIVSHYLYKMPLLWFCPIFITKLITELSAHRLFYSQSKSLPSRYCSVLLFTFVNSVNMLSCLSGDSFSNQRKKTGTHLYSSSRVAGKQSARYFQFGLAQDFLLCGWVRTCRIFRWAWSSTSTWTSATKQTMERSIDEKAGVLETERVFDVSITQLKSSLCTDVPPPSEKRLLLRAFVFETVETWSNWKAVNSTFAIFESNTFSGYFFLWSVPYNDIINNLQLSETWPPFRWTFPLFLAVNQSLGLKVEENY